MKFSYKWLKEYINIDISPQILSETLTMIGIEVENYSQTKDKDVIFELELTSNRPDCANMIGLAREIGAALKKRVKYPVFKIKEGKDNIKEFIKVDVQDAELCPRYAARYIKDVKVEPSPLWLKSYLEKVGIRAINNVVDATNFVLMELGHPLHAFDADTLNKNQLVVRRAKKVEKILTIDMVERELSPEILVIADAEKPQAIAGIMGGNLSEVKDGTKNVLLESAYFNKIAIRRAGKRLNMMTEASYRFERGADPEGLINALNRAAVLIQKLAGGKIAKGTIDIYKKRIFPTTIELNLDSVNRLLGTQLNLIQIKGILKNLEFKVKSTKKSKIQVKVPSFRGDIEREIDLIEEIARHYGYSKIESIPPSAIIAPYPKQSEEKIKEVIFDTLIKLGLQEVINYSFINMESILKINLNERVLGKDFIKIENPISQDQDIMRPTLLIGLLNNVVWNFNRQIDEVKIFEVGKIFYLSERNKSKFIEKMAISFVLSRLHSKILKRGVTPFDLLELKGIIETLFTVLGISDVSLKKRSWPCFHPQNSAWIIKNGKKLGWWGEFNPIILENLELKGKVFGAEIILDDLIPLVNLSKQYKPLPKFPSIKRDLSLLVPEEVTSAEITKVIKKEGGKLIEKIDLFDVYQGEQIPSGFKSLGYTLTYRSPAETLTDEQVNDVHHKISQLLEQTLKIKTRGG